MLNKSGGRSLKVLRTVNETCCSCCCSPTFDHVLDAQDAVYHCCSYVLRLYDCHCLHTFGISGRTTHSILLLLPYDLFRIQRARRGIIVDLDTSPLFTLTIRLGQFPPTFTFRGSQPESHQMPPRPLFSIFIQLSSWVILIRRPGVKDVCVG